MATMNVSLPDEMKSWVEQQAETGTYSNSSDYVRDLIRRDKTRQQKIAQMQTRVTEAVESGQSTKTMADILATARTLAAQK